MQQQQHQLQLIGILHIGGMVLQSIYGILFQKNTFDILYLQSFLCISISWLVFKDECIISYLMKKYENPKYVLGSEPENITDIIEILPEPIYYVFFYINHYLRMISVLVVNNRTTTISYYICIPSILMYTFYVYDIHYKMQIRKHAYPYFQIVFFIYLCIFLWKTIYIY